MLSFFPIRRQAIPEAGLNASLDAGFNLGLKASTETSTNAGGPVEHWGGSAADRAPTPPPNFYVPPLFCSHPTLISFTPPFHHSPCLP